MVILDITVVNIALPSIGSDLGLSPAALTWVVTAYTLCFGGLLLLGGRLADAYGPRRTFLVGLVAFTTASVASGLAQDGATLLAGRAAQGLGAALLTPAALALVATIFDGGRRHRALGVWAAVTAAGGAVGVLVGGALTELASWRWAFLINLPVGLVIGALVPLLVAGGRPARHRRIDLPGAVLATLATGLISYGLIRVGPDGWLSAGAGVPLLAGLILGANFLIVEANTRDPLVPLGLLTRRSSVGGLLTMLVASGFMLSTFFLTSLLLQRVLGLSALATGLVFLPVALLTLVSTHIAVRALRHVGPAVTAAAGFALAATGGVLLAFTSADDTWSGVLPGMLVLATGAGACFVTAATATMATVEHERAGVMSALLTTGHELGASLGVAAVSAIAATSIAASIHPDAGGPASLAGFRTAYLALAVAAGLMALAAPWLLSRTKLPTGDGPAFVH
jgi:EmrB/QacA subfamily drug resistance transporter